MGMNLTRKEKKDNHHFLNLQEGKALLQVLLPSVLPVGRKVIHFPVIRRAKSTSDRADSEEESDGEMLWSLPSWRPL